MGKMAFYTFLGGVGWNHAKFYAKLRGGGLSAELFLGVYF